MVNADSTSVKVWVSVCVASTVTSTCSSSENKQELSVRTC